MRFFRPKWLKNRMDQAMSSAPQVLSVRPV
jgi:hypothetical protein